MKCAQRADSWVGRMLRDVERVGRSVEILLRGIARIHGAFVSCSEVIVGVTDDR